MWRKGNALMILREACLCKGAWQSKWAILNRRIWVNGYYDTYCRMSGEQKRQYKGFKWGRTKQPFGQIWLSDLSTAEKWKECFLSSPLIENRFVYPLLIYIRRSLND